MMGRHHSSHSSHICTRRLDETLAINPFLVRTPPTSAPIPPRRDPRRPRPPGQLPALFVAAREPLGAARGQYAGSFQICGHEAGSRLAPEWLREHACA